MQTTIQLFDLWGQGVNTAGGAQMIAVKMPLNGQSTGQQEPADGFAAVMSMLMALPAEDLRTSLSLLDWVPLEEAGDQLVPMIDLTASEGNGLQMVAQMLESVGTAQKAPFFGDGEQGIAPGPGRGPGSSGPVQAIAAAGGAIEHKPEISAHGGIPIGNAPPSQAEMGPSDIRTHAPASDDPMVRFDAKPKEAASAGKGAGMPLEAVESQGRGLPAHAAGTESEIGSPVKTRIPALSAQARTGQGTPQMTQGARIAEDVAVSPEPGKTSLEAARPTETAARAVPGEGAIVGAAEEAMPDMGPQSGSGGREQMGELAQKPQSEVPGPSAETAAEKQSPLPPRESAAADIMRQIVERMTLRTDKLQSQMQIRLKPEFLGDVRLQVITENHQVMVRISAQSQAVKEMIEQNVLQLKNELQQHGLQIDKFDVFVGTDSGNFRHRRNPATAEQRYSNRHGRSQQRAAAEVGGALNVDPGQIRQSTRGVVDFFA